MPRFPQKSQKRVAAVWQVRGRIGGSGFAWCLGVLTILVLPGPVSARPLVAVGVESGRVFVGEIAPQTNHDELWLRVEKNGASLMRPISWKTIRMAGDGRRTYSSDELKSLANEANSLDNPTAIRSARPSRTSIPEELPAPVEWQPDTRRADAIREARARNAQVAFISLDAYVANWNQTVESDGILLHVYPTSSHGEIIPVDGTLEVQLIASVPPGWRQGNPFPQIGRWSFRVSREQFGPGGAIFRLPFQAKHPEFDLAIQPMGLVHARLNVPGNGSFEASRSMVRIRPYSAVRDQQQQINSGRFFDVERTERFGPR